MSTAAKAMTGPSADTYFFVPFGKTIEHDDGTVTVAGKISSETRDADDQIVDRDMIKRLLPKWARWSNIREMHGPKAIGKGQDYWFDDDGDPCIAARIVDPDAVKKVRHGVLQGFSVGLHHPKIRRDPNAPKGRIYDAADMPEISAVDRPANPDCPFAILKMLGPGEWLDCQKGLAFREDVPDGVSEDATQARARQGDIQDPWAGNSEDVGAGGTPLLEPGRLNDNAVAVEVISLDDRAAIVRMDGVDWVCPYTVDSDGVHVDMEAASPLPAQLRSQAPPPLEAAHEVPPIGGAIVREEAAPLGGESMVTDEDEAEKAMWSTTKVNDLPDASFAFISPGGTKDDGGKTTPRDLRHLPYKDADGKPDAAHVRNALARLDQTDIPAKAKAAARRKLEAAAKEVGVDVADAKKVSLTDMRDAALKAKKDMAHCPECNKQVKCMERVEEKAMAGGKHAVYKGSCGHMVGRFEPEEKAAKAAEPEDATKGTPAQEHAVSAAIDHVEGAVETLKDKQEADEGDKAAKPKGEPKEGADQALAPEGEPKEPAAGKEPEDDEDDEEEMAAKVARILGMTPREIARTARARHKASLITTLEKLLTAARDIPDEPNVALKGGRSPSSAPERNDLGPAPAVSGDWLQRIREDVPEVQELVRMLERSEPGLVHGDTAPPSRLSREIGSSPRSKPAGPVMDQRLDDLPTPQGAQDFTGKVFTAEQVKQIAAAAAAAASAEVAEKLASAEQRLGVVEHMARPAAAPVTPTAGYQERGSTAPFASPEQYTRNLGIDPATLAAMTPQARERMLTQLVGDKLRAG